VPGFLDHSSNPWSAPAGSGALAQRKPRDTSCATGKLTCINSKELTNFSLAQLVPKV
jgi:hypothetical protein